MKMSPIKKYEKPYYAIAVASLLTCGMVEGCTSPRLTTDTTQPQLGGDTYLTTEVAPEETTLAMMGEPTIYQEEETTSDTEEPTPELMGLVSIPADEEETEIMLSGEVVMPSYEEETE